MLKLLIKCMNKTLEPEWITKLAEVYSFDRNLQLKRSGQLLRNNFHPSCYQSVHLCSVFDVVEEHDASFFEIKQPRERTIVMDLFYSSTLKRSMLYVGVCPRCKIVFWREYKKQ